LAGGQLNKEGLLSRAGGNQHNKAYRDQAGCHTTHHREISVNY